MSIQTIPDHASFLDYSNVESLENASNHSSFKDVAIFPYSPVLGDQVSRRGALTGGFYDSQKSRLSVQRKMVETTARFEQEEQQLRRLKQKVSDILFHIRWI